ncbi:hypothetical protein [Magnetococcus sp. PR-3]|uniref:hypothetical protein n=1 Tax=Magnetococcus sp. PR-3 TaxID=3120355 RepID=UPI002FCE1174
MNGDTGKKNANPYGFFSISAPKSAWAGQKKCNHLTANGRVRNRIVFNCNRFVSILSMLALIVTKAEKTIICFTQIHFSFSILLCHCMTNKEARHPISPLFLNKDINGRHGRYIPYRIDIWFKELAMKVSKMMMGLAAATAMTMAVGAQAGEQAAATAEVAPAAYEAKMPYFPGYYNPYAAFHGVPSMEEGQVPFAKSPFKFQKTLMESQFSLHRKMMEDQYTMYKKLMDNKAFQGPKGEELKKEIMAQQDKLHNQMMENHDNMQKQLLEQIATMQEKFPKMNQAPQMWRPQHPWAMQRGPWGVPQATAKMPAAQ